MGPIEMIALLIVIYFMGVLGYAAFNIFTLIFTLIMEEKRIIEKKRELKRIFEENEKYRLYKKF